eukprot:TRINITY_DN10237_c0_g1_i1.p1 TRINITY_DN10237_c0_g1~~TRINITY_DN10237_c0_g1_i1.p1  ORF type:complete len:388 (-),score=17.02 TRINITY_DN10237_c0_g1_i1:475-1638(-)
MAGMPRWLRWLGGNMPFPLRSIEPSYQTPAYIVALLMCTCLAMTVLTQIVAILTGRIPNVSTRESNVYGKMPDLVLYEAEPFNVTFTHAAIYGCDGTTMKFSDSGLPLADVTTTSDDRRIPITAHNQKWNGHDGSHIRLKTSMLTPTFASKGEKDHFLNWVEFAIAFQQTSDLNWSLWPSLAVWAVDEESSNSIEKNADWWSLLGHVDSYPLVAKESKALVFVLHKSRRIRQALFETNSRYDYAAHSIQNVQVYREGLPSRLLISESQARELNMSTLRVLHIGIFIIQPSVEEYVTYGAFWLSGLYIARCGGYFSVCIFLFGVCFRRKYPSHPLAWLTVPWCVSYDASASDEHLTTSFLHDETTEDVELPACDAACDSEFTQASSIA